MYQILYWFSPTPLKVQHFDQQGLLAYQCNTLNNDLFTPVKPFVHQVIEKTWHVQVDLESPNYQLGELATAS